MIMPMEWQTDCTCKKDDVVLRCCHVSVLCCAAVVFIIIHITDCDHCLFSIVVGSCSSSGLREGIQSGILGE